MANNKSGEILDGIKELLWKLIVKMKTDERVRSFLDNFKKVLADNKYSAKEELSVAFARLQEKHFPNFEEEESKKLLKKETK